MWEFKICLQFRCRWQAILQGDSRLQNASIKSWNLNLSGPEGLLGFIAKHGDDSIFPNLRIALQIMLTMAESIASCERFFSKVKLILSYLQSSMNQGRGQIARIKCVFIFQKIVVCNCNMLCDSFVNFVSQYKYDNVITWMSWESL